MTMSGVAHFTEEDLTSVFEPNAKTAAGYNLSKAKGIYREWLTYVNQRILLPPSIEYISEEGVAAGLMAWNGVPLNWSKIIYNNIKLELMKKRIRGVLSLHSAVYLTKMMDPTQPTVPPPTSVNSTVLNTTEIGSPSQEPVTKKRKELKSQEHQEFAIRLRAQNPTAGPSSFTLDQLESQGVIVLGDTLEETISAVQTTVQQKSGEFLSKESAIYRAMELSTHRIQKMMATKQTMEEEKVKLTADVERSKRAMLTMTLEMEGMKEELQTYRQISSTFEQSQIDHTQLKEDFQKLKAEHQNATESLVYFSGIRKDLNKDYYKIHKENEGLKHKIETLRSELHQALYGEQSNRHNPTAELQQKQQEVILITSEKDRLQQEVDTATQHNAGQLDQIRALAWDQELRSPPSFSLFRAYELQRDVLLKTLNLPLLSQLDSSLFDLV
jgi:predicted  nucleic acid-binding Zn-ribbon protein